MRKSFAVLIFGLSVLFYFSCSKESGSSDIDCTGIVASYDANIKLILNTTCNQAGCHAASNPAGGLDLSTYTKAKNEALNGNLICSIEHGSGCTPMPDGAAKLDVNTIKLFKCWVQNGAPQ